jgi:hypothetical protein
MKSSEDIGRLRSARPVATQRQGKAARVKRAGYGRNETIFAAAFVYPCRLSILLALRFQAIFEPSASQIAANCSQLQKNEINMKIPKKPSLVLEPDACAHS